MRNTPSCKKGIPYGQFLRVRRICSKLDDFDKHSISLATHFMRRGYPLNLIEDAFIKARRQERHTLLHPIITPDNHHEENPFFFVTTYHPSLQTPGRIIKTNRDILARHKTTLPLYNTPVIYGYRRAPNLRDMLVRAKLPSPPTINAENPPTCEGRQCKSPNLCRYCPKMVTTGNITSKTTGRPYRIKTNVNCRSNNLIYCMQCTKCNIQYIGETKRSILERFQGHFYNVNTQRNTDVIGLHYNLPDHRGLEDISIYVLEFVHVPPDHADSKTIRLRQESAWIHRLRTMSPHGLNIKDTTSW